VQPDGDVHGPGDQVSPTLKVAKSAQEPRRSKQFPKFAESLTLEFKASRLQGGSKRQLLALNGPPSMSAVRSLLGGKRTPAQASLIGAIVIGAADSSEK